MTKPEDLKQTDKLPDDLKAMLAEMKVPTTDPVIPLLTWIWKQMSEAKGTLETARASVAAVFDDRLEQIAIAIQTAMVFDHEQIKQRHPRRQPRPNFQRLLPFRDSRSSGVNDGQGLQSHFSSCHFEII